MTAAFLGAACWKKFGLSAELRGGTGVALAMAAAWAQIFGWLAVQRHQAGGSHAEDLGFTDQVLGNFLRGQWFRMSIYQGATWNTELDIARIVRPDSLLAFHFEPMLLLLVPLYAIGGGATLLLIVQAIAFAAGAIPAYRLGQHCTGASVGGLAVAGAYLLSPLGQWAVLADFHTSTLAAPLLLLAVERLVVGKSGTHALIASGLAATAREDVGLAVAALAIVLLAARKARPATGLAMLGIGVGSSLLAALVIRAYSGGILPFDVRYGPTLGGGPGAALSALARPAALGYVETIALSGGWLGLLAPLALVPAMPSLALNLLSTSPWMMAGKAHYSGLVVPFIAAAAAAGLGRLRHHTRTMRLACAGLLLTSAGGYALEGAGPIGSNYAPALLTDHARRAAALAQGLPRDAAVSATSALVPRLSNRPRAYVFPAVLDADYVFLDLRSSPAPTSAGDVHRRVASLLEAGGWQVEHADDGLLMLKREDEAGPTEMSSLFGILEAEPMAPEPRLGRNVAESELPWRVTREAVSSQPRPAEVNANVSLFSAELRASANASIDVDGPRGELHTVWRPIQPLQRGTHLEFWLDLTSGESVHVWDLASLCWYPPEHWVSGQLVSVDVPDVPMRRFRSWRAVWSTS